MSLIRKSIVAALLVSLMLVGTGPSSAQSGIDLDALAPITSENVDQLEQITSFEITSEWVDFAISPDGKTVAVVDNLGLRVLDMSTGEMGEYLIDQSVSSPTFSADGGVIAANTVSVGSNTLFVITLNDGDAPDVTSLDVAGIMGAGTALNSDGTAIAYSVSAAEPVSDATWRGYHIGPSVIHIVELATMSDLKTFEDEHAILGRMFFSPDGTQLSYSSVEWPGPQSPFASDAHFQLLDVETGEKSAPATINNILMEVSDDWSLAYFSPLNPLAGMVSCLSPAAVVNLGSEANQFTLAGDDCSSWQVDFSPDATLVAGTQGTGPTVSILETENGTEINALSVDHAESVYNAVFSQDGKLLLMASTMNGLATIHIYGVPVP